MSAPSPELPIGQRPVDTLQDVEGLAREKMCTVLGISEGNRVLLHRAQARIGSQREQEVLL